VHLARLHLYVRDRKHKMPLYLLIRGSYRELRVHPLVLDLHHQSRPTFYIYLSRTNPFHYAELN